MLQNATPLRPFSALTSWHLWWTCVLYCACHGKCIFPDPPTPAILFGNARKPSRFAHFDKVHNPLRRPRETTSERPKVFRARQFFGTFGLEMCFARRALFRHLSFQKWSEQGVLCTFWLGNVLCATTACNFSSLICPHGSGLLFEPPAPQNIGKTQCFATLLHFRVPASSFFSLFLCSDLLSSALLFSSLLWLFPPLLFHLSILSEGGLLNLLPRWIVLQLTLFKTLEILGTGAVPRPQIPAEAWTYLTRPICKRHCNTKND